MALLRINSRLHFFNCDSITVEPVSNGRWKVTYDNSVVYDAESEGHSFIIVGGKKSGGRSNEWFCYHPLFFGEEWMPCKSMVEAIKLGVQY